MLPFASLAAAAATGLGAARDFEDTLATHGMVVTVTGGPSAWRVYLEGSLDGATWTRMAELNESTSGIVTISPRPVRFVRANLDILTGGTSPTVTATIAST